MSSTIQVDIVSAHEPIYSGLVEFIVLPGEAGELGVLPGHAPLLSRLHPGMLRLKPSASAPEENFFISGGLVEIQPTHVTVLADIVVRAKGMDEAKALDAMRQAHLAIEDAQTKQDFARVEAEIANLSAHLFNLRATRNR